MKPTLPLLALLLSATSALAQGADDPGYQMIDGVGACVLGGGDNAKTVEELTRLGWTVEADAGAGVTDFRAAGDKVFGFVSADGKTCVVESNALSTEDAQTMFNLFFMGGNSGIERGDTGTDADGCATQALSNGGVATLTSGGNDPTCASEDTAAWRFAY
jgi:hypothetical protein